MTFAELEAEIERGGGAAKTRCYADRAATARMTQKP